MDVNYAKDWIVPITTAMTLITVATSSIIGVLAYRLNLRAEIRLKESAKAEIDVKLLGVMVNLIEKANGRNGYEVSHDAIKKLLDSKRFNEIEWVDPENRQIVTQLIHDTAIVSLPVGFAEQSFAIKAIGELGYQHAFLRTISLTTLEELNKIERLGHLCKELITKIATKASSQDEV